MSDSIVIVSAARTPIGGLLGDFASLQAWELGAVAIQAAVERDGVPGDAVNEVLMGNCLMAGQGQAPARQAMRRAGLPDATGAVTLSKMCGSGMRAMMFAHDMLLAGTAEVMVAGGMESMTNAPYLLPNARKGYRLGNGQLIDSMVHDGLWDKYNDYHMGITGENVAEKYGIKREEQDEFAANSHRKAIAAWKECRFKSQVVPVDRVRNVQIAEREDPLRNEPFAQQPVLRHGEAMVLRQRQHEGIGIEGLHAFDTVLLQ